MPTPEQLTVYKYSIDSVNLTVITLHYLQISPYVMGAQHWHITDIGKAILTATKDIYIYIYTGNGSPTLDIHMYSVNLFEHSRAFSHRDGHATFTSSNCTTVGILDHGRILTILNND